jgi:uncharacterized protein YjbJ (UPF0337 family)
MDWKRVEGNWKQIKGTVKEQWGKLTDDDLDVIGGKREQLEGKIQQRYGYAKDQGARRSTTGTAGKTGDGLTGSLNGRPAASCAGRVSLLR